MKGRLSATPISVKRILSIALIYFVRRMRAMNGSHLRAVRDTLDLTQADLAHRLGVHKQSISCWEAGSRPIPRYVQAWVLALAEQPDPDIQTIAREIRPFSF